jgi:hypothetical protein
MIDGAFTRQDHCFGALRDARRHIPRANSDLHAA